MSKTFQLRRGTTAQHNTFVGAVGEVTVDTDKNSLRVHNGVQLGGFEIDTNIVMSQFRKFVDPSSAPYNADRTGTLSASSAFEQAIAVAKLFKLDVIPSPGSYRLDGAALDLSGIKLKGSAVYTRENTVFTDSGVVLMHASATNSMFVNGRGWEIEDIIFYDPLQLGTGAAPVLTRPPLIQSKTGFGLIDWTINKCVFVNMLDLIKTNPGQIMGDARFTNNRVYAIRYAFWIREWCPESIFIANNIFTPGIYDQVSRVSNSAMLKKWTEQNGFIFVIDMTAATSVNKSVDGLKSVNNLYFGSAWSWSVSGGFDLSTSTGDTFDNCRRIMQIDSAGFCYDMKFNGLNAYLKQNETPSARCDAFRFSSVNSVEVTCSGGKISFSSGDILVDDGSGATIFTMDTNIDTIGGATIVSPPGWALTTDAYVARVGNPAGRYSFRMPFVNNKGGYPSVVAFSIAEAEEFNLDNVSIYGAKTPISIENSVDSTSLINITCVRTRNTIGTKSLEVGAGVVTAGVVKCVGNRFDKTTDVANTN